MKGFGTFDTTNTLYGSFYSRQQDPVTNIPKFSKPDMEEQYYFKTLEMQKGYFNRYAHLYEDPTGKPIYNPIDSKAFKEEDGQQYIPKENVPQQGEIINAKQRRDHDRRGILRRAGPGDEYIFPEKPATRKTEFERPVRRREDTCAVVVHLELPVEESPEEEVDQHDTGNRRQLEV